MKSRWLIPPLLVGLILGWQGSAQALSISFSFLEPTSGSGNIEVSVMNITGSTSITSSPELATVSVGTVTGPSTLLARVALTQPGSMHMEGGGMGVSDLLELRTFSAGFLVSFQSDGETGIPNPGGLTATHVETGLPQTLLFGAFTLPVVGSVDLTVTGQSDLDPVPEPVTMVLFGTALAGAGLAARWGRRRRE